MRALQPKNVHKIIFSGGKICLTNLISDGLDCTALHQTADLLAIEIGNTNGSNQTYTNTGFHRAPGINKIDVFA